MDKRYQVFVSSTYTDLVEERQQVTQALMEMDCIPAGMELFPAVDEEQWEFIKKVIDDCDYYLLIVGGRYGSLTAEGISYTEKEYDYAIEKNIKVIALLHGDPGAIPSGKTDMKPELREKLQNFRDKVSDGRLVKYWTEASELPGLVALSIAKTIKTFPATGWVRATEASSQELLSELNDLRKENKELKTEYENLQQKLHSSQPNNIPNVDELAGLEEEFSVNGSYQDNLDRKESFQFRITWGKIFAAISPNLSHPTEEYKIAKVFGDIAQERVTWELNGYQISKQDLQTIRLQFQALGLIRIEYAPAEDGDMANYWSLTPEGEQKMFEVVTIKTKKDRSRFLSNF